MVTAHGERSQRCNIISSKTNSDLLTKSPVVESIIVEEFAHKRAGNTTADTPKNQTITIMNANATLSHAGKKKPIHSNTFQYLLFTLLYIMHTTGSAANGSFSPMAAFAPPSHSIVQPQSQPSQWTSEFNYRNSYHKSSIQEPSMTNRIVRRKSNALSKIKSPSNSYNQFYKEGVLVGIERTSSNSRRISGEIIMDIPVDDIWSILTDYDNLSSHVPNLVESKVINNGGKIVDGRPRVYQRGAQRIFGFEFGADVTMDMTENVHHLLHHDEMKMYSIDFECVDSQFFSQFDGSWILEEYSDGKTMVRYIVDVRPKGPVPVAALEWRIKEDVPVNILAVSKSAGARSTKRRAREQTSGMAEEDIEMVPQLQPLREQPKPQPQSSNPLQQLTDRAAFDIKRTAKLVLPSPVVSTARQALKAMNVSSFGVAASRQKTAPAMVVSGSKNKSMGRNKNILSSRDSDVDWYEDETMAMYL